MRSLTRNMGVHLVIILALLSAGISPACAFVSGKMTLIEICSAEGLVTISIPADDAKGQTDIDHKRSYDCGFCLMQSSSKGLTTPIQAIIDFSFVYSDVSFPAPELWAADTLDGHLPARGPPAFL